MSHLTAIKNKLIWSATSQEWSAHLTPDECVTLLAFIQEHEKATGTVDIRKTIHSGDPGDEQP